MEGGEGCWVPRLAMEYICTLIRADEAVIGLGGE